MSACACARARAHTQVYVCVYWIPNASRFIVFYAFPELTLQNFKCIGCLWAAVIIASGWPWITMTQDFWSEG